MKLFTIAALLFLSLATLPTTAEAKKDTSWCRSMFHTEPISVRHLAITQRAIFIGEHRSGSFWSDDREVPGDLTFRDEVSGNVTVWAPCK